MTDNSDYDPFAGDAERDPNELSRIAKGDPMDELLAAPEPISSETRFGDNETQFADEGWDPVQEEKFHVRSLDMGEVATAFSSPVAIAHTHSNPLPGMRATAPEEAAEGQGEGDSKAPRGKGDYYHSNEAILSGVQSGVRQGAREALPTRNDAPRIPETIGERRPVAWMLPLFVCGAGGAAGWYLYTELNPVIGAIAMALGLVGAMLLRVTLKR